MFRVGSSELSWQRIHYVERICRAKMFPLTVNHLVAARHNPDYAITEWIRKQLTLRLAYRLHEFHLLPFFVSSNPYIKASYDWHYALLESFMKLPMIKSAESQEGFLSVLREQRQNQDPTVNLLGQGVKQVYYAVPNTCLNSFIERFFCFRIGQRLIADHLLAPKEVKDDVPGCVATNCHAAKLVQECVNVSRNTCRGTYAIAPGVDVEGDLDSTLCYVPDHVLLIVTEIIKNALRATVESYTFSNTSLAPAKRTVILDETDLPKVGVAVHRGKDEVMIRVSDKGGGISPEQLNNIFTFGYSSIHASQESAQGCSLDSFVRSDIAGYGFGLPLARTFARYFGGDIRIMPCFGVGTDVFIILPDIAPAQRSSASWKVEAPVDECIPGDAVAHRNGLVSSSEHHG